MALYLPVKRKGTYGFVVLELLGVGVQPSWHVDGIDWGSGVCVE